MEQPEMAKWQSTFIRIRSNKVFETFIILIIITSALLVGVKTYSVPPWVLTAIYVLDLAITLIFIVEITIRFLEFLQGSLEHLRHADRYDQPDTHRQFRYGTGGASCSRVPGTKNDQHHSRAANAA